MEICWAEGEAEVEGKWCDVHGMGRDGSSDDYMYLDPGLIELDDTLLALGACGPGTISIPYWGL